MKQVILARKDLKMGAGKLAVQVAHASVEAVLKSDRKKVLEWQSEGMKKVVLRVDSLKELLNYQKQASGEGLRAALITDAAKTFFDKPTTTCLAIGPDAEGKIDLITGKLKIY